MFLQLNEISKLHKSAEEQINSLCNQVFLNFDFVNTLLTLTFFFCFFDSNSY